MKSVSTSGLPPSSAPPIVVSSRDLARLEKLVESPALRRHPSALALAQELSRAEVLSPDKVPSGVVTMNSRVDCVDEVSGERRTLTLVYPDEANVDTGHVSILAPVGMALLGLAIGSSIDWAVPSGRAMRLRVDVIHYQPENEGHLSR